MEEQLIKRLNKYLMQKWVDECDYPHELLDKIKLYFMDQDVETCAEQMYDEDSDEYDYIIDHKREIAEYAIENLNNNDDYMESYWESVRVAVNVTLEEMEEE